MLISQGEGFVAYLKDTEYCRCKKEVLSSPNNLLLFHQQLNISQDKLAEAVTVAEELSAILEKEYTTHPYRWHT